MRLITDAYRLDERGIAAKAAAGEPTGEPAMVRLRDGGVVEAVRADQEWTAAHRTMLERALR